MSGSARDCRGKRRLLFVMGTLRAGGAEKVLVDIILDPRMRELDVDLLLFFAAGPHLARVAQAANIKRLFGEGAIDFRSAPRALRPPLILLRKLYCRLLLLFPRLIYALYLHGPYDVEVAFLPGPHARIVSRSPNKSSRKIAWIHSDSSSWEGTKPRAEERSFSAMDDIVCVSDDVKASFMIRYPSIEKERIRTILNPVKASRILAAAMEGSVDRPEGFMIAGLGRLSREKGFDLLIEALALALPDSPSAFLWIMGDGPERPRLEKLIAELGLADRASLLGFRENPFPQVAVCDLFVLPSRHEGFPLALAEALILGKPVIATACAGSREILGGGEFGWLLEEDGDERKLVRRMAEAIVRLSTDKEMLGGYRRKSASRASFFAYEEQMEKVFSLFARSATGGAP